MAEMWRVCGGYVAGMWRVFGGYVVGCGSYVAFLQGACDLMNINVTINGQKQRANNNLIKSKFVQIVT